MRDKRGSETELRRYLNALCNYVTQSKHAERIDETGKEEESGQIFRAIFENAADGILVVDLESKKLYMGNRVLCQMLGYSQQELRTLEVGDIHPEEDFVYVIEKFEEQVREERTLAEDVPVKRKDGSVFYADINSFPITLGRKAYLMSILRDITKRKHAEEKLKRSEETFRLAMEATNDALWDWNMVTNEVYRNPRHATMLGYQSHEFGASQVEWEKRIHPDDKSLMTRLLSEHLEGKRDSIDVEYRLLTKTGDYIWVLGRGKVVAYNHDGSPARMVGTNVDITERKKAEEALERSEKKWYSLLRNIPDFILNLDSDGTVLFINHTLPGSTVEQTLGRTVYDFIPPEEHEKTEAAIYEVFETGRKVKFETRVIAPDGRLLWYLNHLGPVKDGDTAVSVAQVSTDITELKRIQAMLQTKNAAIASSINGIAIGDAEGNLTYVNKSFLDMWGFEDEHEVLGRNASEFWQEKDQALEIIDALRDKGGWIGELTATRKDGSARDVQVCATAVTSEDDRPLSIMASFIDITHRKNMEKTLAESEKKYRMLVESAGEAITTIDENGVFLFMNRIGAERMGGTPEDYIGKTMWDLFPKEIADVQAASIRRVINNKQGENLIVLSEIQGEPRWYNTTVQPLADWRGDVAAAMVIARDIHFLKQAQDQLNAYREQMARAEQLASLGTLSATIAHQVTQPLTVIRLSLDNVLDELEGTSCSSTVLRRLRDSVTQVSNITSIINRFRNFARQSSDTAFGQVNVHAVVVRVARLLAESAKQARVALRVEDMSTLPSVLLHEREFEQILFALVENAIQAADGKKVRHLVISGSVKDEQIELRFSDNCAGIHPENRKKIFEPFFTTKPRGQGTGLGLCIVQDAVARVGGRVRVESKWGRGSTFFVTLPVDDD